MGKTEGTYKGRGAPQAALPILSLACEGETEYRHAHALTKQHQFIKLRGKVFPGRHGELLVDDAVNLAAQRAQEHPETIIVPAVLYDLETVSNADIRTAREAHEYAKRHDIHLFVNAPTIERWFLLAVAHKSIRTSPRVINQELNKLLREQGMPNYRKPGDAFFHNQLALHVDQALERCKTSGHLEGLPCMCQFVQLIRSF